MTTTSPTSATSTFGNISGSNAAVLNQINSQNASSVKNQQSQNALTGGSGSQAAASAQSLAGNLNTFLTMLTTQLKNQDPLSPMDSTQFTNQLVQFASVEQQINSNSNLEKLISLQTTSQQASAINYVGQTVEVPGSSLPLQNGKAYFSYTLPSDASQVSISVTDQTGAVVANIPAISTATGTHQMVWKGTGLNGSTLPDGQYTLNITATDATQQPITATTTVYGKVTGVTSDPTNGTELSLGAVPVPMSQIQSIVDPANLPTG
jgi:flagellar basal-body rod modification protein FlgD